MGGGGEGGDVSPVYSVFSYANYTQAQCFGLEQAQQIDCLEQMLNVTNPPSIYNYFEYSNLWEPVACLLSNVTLQNRADDDATFNYCTVPLRGYDAFLFVSLALLATCVLFGKLSTVLVLITGGILGVVNYYVNLLQISNAISLWLSIQPADLFFYAFLPPLLLEQAIRVDFFMFRKIWVHALLMAFVMVLISAIALTPFILFVMGFQSRGWSWVHGALLSAIISPTDALAVASILARANGPERLVAVMEGESLFNDASAITLFEVFSHLIYTHVSTLPEVWPSVWSVIPTIIVDILRLSAVGLGIGLGFSWVTWHLLRWLRWRGARPYIETTVVLAGAYLSYYIANSPARGSGVISVVVFGLYGNATSKWGMLATAEESGAFDAVWDMISFSANGVVFFWSGVASLNFFVRSVSNFERTAWSYVAIPLIYLFMVLIRSACVGLFNPLFKALGEGLSPAEIVFIGFAGLRGSVSLIMVSAFATGTRLTLASPGDSALVNADISLWASAFVVLTLVINGPLIAPLLKLLKLNVVPLEKLKMRSRAKRALCRFTEQQLNDLRDDDDEFLQGANWDAVAQYVDMSGSLEGFDAPTKAEKGPTKRTESTGSDSVDLSTTTGVLKLIWKAAFGKLGRMCRRPKPKVDSPKASISSSDGKESSDEGNKGVGKPQPQPPPPTTHHRFTDILKPRKSINPSANVSFSNLTTTTSNSGSESPHGPASPGKLRHRHGPWEEITAEELAREVHDECPFLDKSSDSDESGAGGGAPPGGPSDDNGVDIEMGKTKLSISNAEAAAIAAATALESGGSGHGGSSYSNLQSITEGKVMAHGSQPPQAAPDGDVDDQMCLTGAAGAKLLSELKRTMTAAEQHNIEHTLPPDYYASLPAGLGAKMKEQLQLELASYPGPAPVAFGQGPTGAAAGPSGDEAAADYYCSLPALAGKALQEELKKLASQEGGLSSAKPSSSCLASSPRAGGASGAGTSRLGSSPRLGGRPLDFSPDYYSSLPAGAGRAMREELQRRLTAEQATAEVASATVSPFYMATSKVSSTTSVPAATGKSMQAELLRRLRRQSAHSRGASTDSTPAGGRSPSVSSPRISGGRPVDWYSYHNTVSGVSGANLASELRDHLRNAPAVQTTERDLLGRKKAPRPPIDSSQRSSNPSQRGQIQPRPMQISSATAEVRSLSLARERAVGPAATPMATALLDKKKSNLHALRQNTTHTEKRAALSMMPIPSMPLNLARQSAGAIDASGSGAKSSPGMAARGGGPTLRPSKTEIHRSLQSFDSRSGAPAAAADTSALLLARTFSVGASLHHRGKSGHARDGGGVVVSDDADADDAAAAAAAADDDEKKKVKDGSGDDSGGMGVKFARSASATTLRDGSLPGSKVDEAQEEQNMDIEETKLVAEMRVRLLAGLKRHFVAKRLAGLLSVEGLRILQYVCDVASDKPENPLRLWASIEKEVNGGWLVRGASRILLSTTRAYRALHPTMQGVFSWPYQKIAGLLRRFLGRKMLVSCEVAVEYYLALLWSPQIQWLKGHGESCWRLLDEVESENDAAYHFIIEREIEAPDRFQAIQSYRAAMAILRQQLLFVQELFETGMVDETEERGLCDPIDKKLRHLELVGPVWRPPRPRQVLRSLPFMANLPDPVFRKLYDSGTFIEFRKGQCIWTATDLVRRTGGIQGPGGFVVLSGVVKRVHIRPDGARKEYFQGTGGVLGILLALTGTKLPGTDLAIAEGNALGKGPLVFHFPQKAVREIQSSAEAGDAHMANLEEELCRLSAAYVVESMEAELVGTMSQHIKNVLSAQAQGRLGAGEQLHRSGSAPVQAPRRTTSDAALGSTLSHEGSGMFSALSRRSTVAGLGAPLGPSSGGTGLVTSKSVGANLAAMMQQIAAMEYEEDEEESDSEGSEDGRKERTSTATNGSALSLHTQQQIRDSVRRSGEFDVEMGAMIEHTRTTEDADRSPSRSPRRGVRFSEPPGGHQHHHLGPEGDAKIILSHALLRAPQLAADASMDIRRALHSSFVLRLEGGSGFDQTSHMVLLSGTLTRTGIIPRNATDSSDALVSAPAVLPWLWHDKWVSGVGSHVGMVESVEWHVGHLGAILVLAHNADGAVPDAVIEWEERVQEITMEKARKAAITVTSYPLHVSNDGLQGGMKRSSSASGSEQGSLTGRSAALMKDQLAGIMGLLRRPSADVRTSPAQK